MKECHIITGDALTSLQALPSGSVHCAITSPPYFGLRDYGTASWEGGDSACDHLWAAESRQAKSGSSNLGWPADGGPRRISDTNQYFHESKKKQYPSICNKCRAVRVDCQIGLESSLDDYLETLVQVFRELWRVLRDDGTFWLNMGDSYARDMKKGQHRPGDSGKQNYLYERGGGRCAVQMDLKGTNFKPKDLMLVPHRLAIALQVDGWYLRNDIIWEKANAMPESVKDRLTCSHEHLFLFAKSDRYYFDAEAIREPVATRGRSSGNVSRKVATAGERSRLNTHAGSSVPWQDTDGTRNRRSVWRVNKPVFAGAHFATFPLGLVTPCILAGTSAGGACLQCGTPYTRIVEKGEPLADWQAACGGDALGEYHGQATKDYAGAKAQNASATKARILAGMRERKTVGWKPGCGCGKGVQPCVVLDCFAGSGTVGEAALRQGRSAILIELNPEYVGLIEKRIAPFLMQESFEEL